MMFEPVNDNLSGKKRIRKIAAVYIGILLLLTFFSKTINNISLPRVIAEQPVSGTLIKEIEGEGIVEARETVHKFAQQGRLVKDVMVKTGDRVEKGQIMVVLDSSDLEKQLATELLRYDRMKLELERLTTDNPQNDLSILERNIISARKNLEAAQNRYNRVNSLFEAGSASQEEVINAEMELFQAEENLENEYQKQKNSQNDINAQQGSLQIEIRIQQISLQMQEITIEDLRKKLAEECKLVSPVDGVVSQLNVEKGSQTNGSLPVFSVVNSAEGFELRVPVDVDKASFINIGDTVDMRIKSINENTLKGVIREITSSTGNKDEMKLICIDIPAEAGVNGGEYCEMYIRKNTMAYGILVPNTAVAEDDKGEFVWVLYEKEKPLGNELYVQRAYIDADDSDSSKTAVLSGISVDDYIVVKYKKNLSEENRVIQD